MMLADISLRIASWAWILTFLIGLVTLFLTKHLLRVRSLPPGPFPLPILGNLLAFQGEENQVKEVMERLAHRYKDLFTLWLGSRPSVVVCSWDLCKEALVSKRNDFSGRIKRHSATHCLDGKEDVMFGDFGPCWETLRKIMHSAVRKYAVSHKLADLSAEVVDSAVAMMLKEEGKPLDANNYVYLILYNVLASSTFGRRFEMDDPEFTGLRKIKDDINDAFGIGLPSDALPMLKWFFRKKVETIKDLSDKFTLYITERYEEHKTTYQKGVVRDFTDAVIAARQEAEEEGSDNLSFLTDGNQVMILSDLFSAGTDSTRITLLWLILLMCNNLEVQKRMVAEIDENIGCSTPKLDDRNVCPYTFAVISETLRFMPVIDTTLEHKSICDTEIGGYKIPKDTSVFFHIASSHHNNCHFEDPHTFKPERFLEANGRFTKARLTGYMPFGLGRRACPGEKLALADIFLITVRLLQKCSFELEGGPGSAILTPSKKEFGNFPEPFNLIAKKREVQA